MEALKIFEKDENVNWDYDADADVLYISLGKPKKAEGIDIGNGVIMRVDTQSNEIVGVTIINPVHRTFQQIKKNL